MQVILLENTVQWSAAVMQERAHAHLAMKESQNHLMEEFMITMPVHYARVLVLKKIVVPSQMNMEEFALCVMEKEDKVIKLLFRVV